MDIGIVDGARFVNIVDVAVVIDAVDVDHAVEDVAGSVLQHIDPGDGRDAVFQQALKL